MKYLFVGGSNDGQRIDVARLQPYIRLYVRRNRPVGILEQPDAEPELETEVYKVTPFRGNNTEFWVYVLDGMTPDSLIQRLIDGYRVSPKPEPSPSPEFWMITISYSSGDLSTICIDETPASWLIKWGGNIGDARHKKHIVFAMPITEDEFKELDQLRP